MDISIESADGRTTLRLAGRFDTQNSLALRNAAKPLLGAEDVSALVIDLEQVSFIDSSGLGLLLLLREQATAVGKSIILSRCSPEVMKVLSITQFHRLFTMQ
jgi:anti-anti-sigma factor